MMNRRHLVKTSFYGVASALTAVALPAWAQAAPELLGEVGRRLDNPDVLRGEFEQAKTIKGFKRPLVSRGTFVMARDRGVQWITAQPFPSTVVVTRDRLLTLGENGSRQQLDARQEPGLRAVNEMLMALLAGDVKSLASRFQAEGALQGAQGWRLALTPRDAALARFMARIELEGDRHVNGVLLQEASGDASRIRFFSHNASALTATEAGRFAP